MSTDISSIENRADESKRQSPKGFLEKYIPITNWLPQYQREDLTGDVLAGLIVAIMLVPQSMAYAMLAGLPPQIGLYASIAPLILYAIFGTSKTLAVGPGAMVSLLTLAGISTLATPGTSEFIVLAFTLALMVGIIQMLLGAAKLGFLVNFLSHPVLVGFTASAGLVIGLSQLKHLFGIKIQNSERPYEILIYTLQNLTATNFSTFAIGLGSVLTLVYFKSFLKKHLDVFKLFPKLGETLSKTGALLVVLAGILLVWFFQMDSLQGVRIVGKIPSGLPALSIPSLEITRFAELLPIALVISLVGFMESISIGTTLASKRREKIEPNQELLAIGVANIGSAFSGGFPVTGGLSRSVVNFSAGARTNLASVFTAVLIAITVLFLTPLFYYLPQATLAAIVIVAVSGLIDYKSFRHIWAYSKADASALLATFFGVLIFNIQTGIMIGVATALLLYLYRTSKPHVAIVGRVGNTEHFRNVLRHKVKTCPETKAVRIDESLYFANARELENTLLSAAADEPSLKNIILICSAVNFIDASALDTLERAIDELKTAGVKTYLAEIKGPVMDRLIKIGFVENFGRENIFLSTHQAFEFVGCEK